MRATMVATQSTRAMQYALLLLFSSFVVNVNGRDVPMQKAIPPLMDPIPTLPEITHRVFFDIEIDGKSVGKIVFGLFGKALPRTTENFRSLAACDKGLGQLSGKPLCYKGTTFHRVVPDFFLQGGDFTHGTGVGGESIFSSGVFEDESFEVNHNRPYMLTMSNCGERDCNGSQFLVTLAKTQWLNGKHVAFGVVLEGQDVARKVEEVGTYGGKPKSTVTIVNCGEEPLKPEDKETHY